METKSIIHFKGEPFMAIVEGRGETPVKCIPVVWDGRDSGAWGGSCGAGVLFEDGQKYVWGLDSPRDLITSWRATEILRRLKVIKKREFCGAYYAASRYLSKDDRKTFAETVIAKIGNKTRNEILAMPVPETIIRAILDNQNDKPAPDFFPIAEELKTGTLRWRPEFDKFMTDSMGISTEFGRGKMLAKFEPLLISYAKFRNRPRQCIGMDDVENTLIKLMEKGVETHPNRIAVALTGAAADMLPCDFTPKYLQLDIHGSISLSVEWLTNSILGKPRFFRRHMHLTNAAEFQKMIQELLTRLLEEYFPAEPVAKTPVPA
jgi:hypothetical protein